MYYVNLGQSELPEEGAITVRAPSGNVYLISPEQEKEMAIAAAEQKIVYRMTRVMSIERAVIGSIGTAIGFAVGSLLAAKMLGEKATR